MATLKEYFDTDFQKVLNVGSTLTLFHTRGQTDIPTRLHQDFDSNSKFLSFYIPNTADNFQALLEILKNIDMALTLDHGVEVKSASPGEKHVSSKDLIFSGKVFVYSELEIDEDKLVQLQAESKQKGLLIQYRGPNYAAKRMELEKPLAFISHDSRDKDAIARPIAIGLTKLMCPVWYDEYSLKVGDKLRESIEKGIKDCKKCVLLLSPNFLSNNGWTKVEFNSIFTRELIEETDIVLPVWCGIDKKELFEYCPSLVNKVGLKLDSGLDEVISKLHSAIKK